MNVGLDCPHRPPCPGCPRLGQPLAESSALAPLAALAAEHDLTLAVHEAPALTGNRCRARLAVRGRIAAPLLGIFEQGSHWVVDIPQCRIHHPRINEVAAALRDAIAFTRTAPYTERTRGGLVRYVQVAVERRRGDVQVVLVVNGEDAAPVRELCDALIERLGAGLQGLFVSPHAGSGNAILGSRCELVHGQPMLVEHIAGARVFFPPDAFGQNNLDVYEQAVQRIGEHVPDGADVVELYAGVGAIGLSLLPRVARVRWNELAGGSLQGLHAGLSALPEALRARAEVHAGSAAEHAGLARGADVVIVDPPRKGLDPVLLDALRSEPPRKLVYLSCDTSSLQRDAAGLLGAGMRLRALDAFDFFPFTQHVETLACFERA